MILAARKLATLGVLETRIGHGVGGASGEP